MKNTKQISKFLSLILRHKPEEIGVSMDSNGWVNVDELIEKSRAKNVHFDFETLEEVVETNDKQRFAFNESLTEIRANQGHSLAVDVRPEATVPPAFLYHGTVDRFLDGIRQQGLQKMQRQHVHLSKDLETAIKVASRRGKPVILKIQSGEMQQDGHTFYRSANGVWLCEQVPALYIQFPTDEKA